MKADWTEAGGFRLELDAREARLLRFVAERASFVDTPPDEQERILRLAEEIIAALDARGAGPAGPRARG